MPQPSFRDKIVRAALKRFMKSGFKACTIEDITSEAGAFKGSFYNHFKSKEALAVATVKLYAEVGHRTIALEGPPAPLKRLRNHFEQMSALLKERHHLQGCLLSNFSAEVTDENSDLRKALNEAMENWCKAIAHILRQAQAAEEISKRHNADLLARYLINAYEGAHVRARATKNHTPIDEFIKVTFEHLLA